MSVNGTSQKLMNLRTMREKEIAKIVEEGDALKEQEENSEEDSSDGLESLYDHVDDFDFSPDSNLSDNSSSGDEPETCSSDESSASEQGFF